MARTVQERLEQAKAKNELLRLQMANRILSRRDRRVKTLLAKYDAPSTGNEKKRRKPTIETQEEDAILSIYERHRASNIGRDLQRNFTQAKGMLNQLALNVVGSLGKLQVNSKDPAFNENAGQFFNQVWAPECDSRDDSHWCEILQNTLTAVVREGDLCVAFDDFNRNDGKLLFWENDQLVSIDSAEWKEQKDWGELVAVPGTGKRGRPQKQFKPYPQARGIVRDLQGRVVAYVVTAKRGQSTVKLADATILKRGTARLIKRPWRLNQGRGVGDMLTAAADLEDSFEMRSKELASAKVASSFAGKVKRRDGVTDYDDPTAGESILPEDAGKDVTEIENQEAGTEKNYDRLEALTGGYMEYMAPEDDFEILDFNRPNLNTKEFYEHVVCSAGFSMGLARAYSLLRADSSYTSFRGDMVLTWVTIYYLQKWLERRMADWCARKAIAWGIRRNAVPASQDANWRYALSWNWPVMPHVDEWKEQQALRLALKNGEKDFATLLGPDWEQKLKSLAEQVQLIRDLDLPLSVLETISGGEMGRDEEEK
jgi:hypothetical protein